MAATARLGLRRLQLHNADRETHSPTISRGTLSLWWARALALDPALDVSQYDQTSWSVEEMCSPAFPHSAEQYLEHLGQRYGVWDEEPTPAAGCASTKCETVFP
jgi:hypothetical protein